MRYEYTFKTAPNIIVGANNMLLAVSEYGPVLYTPNKLTVYTGKNVRYEYSYGNNNWVKIVASTVTFAVKPPTLKCEDLAVDNALFFTLLASVTETNSDLAKNYYRKRREEICYPIINRGQPWYNRLTLVQKTELNDWYEDWLDVTETLVIPTAPSWLNNKLNKIETEELL